MTPRQQAAVAFFRKARPLCPPDRLESYGDQLGDHYVKCGVCGAYVAFFQSEPAYWQSDNRMFADDAVVPCWDEQFTADGQVAEWGEVPV